MSLNSYTSVSRDEMKRWKGKTRHGLVCLHDTIMFLYGGSVTSGGMVAVRPQRGGTATSLHAVGRAGDAMTHNGQGPRAHLSARQVGDELFMRLIAAAPLIGLDEAIWYGLRWTPEKGVRRYFGINQHRDHVHFAVDPSFADNATPRDALCQWIARALFPGV
jgi:hypothetical protein